MTLSIKKEARGKGNRVTPEDSIIHPERVPTAVGNRKDPVHVPNQFLDDS